jgi:hypothetical protein
MGRTFTPGKPAPDQQREAANEGLTAAYLEHWKAEGFLVSAHHLSTDEKIACGYMRSLGTTDIRHPAMAHLVDVEGQPVGAYRYQQVRLAESVDGDPELLADLRAALAEPASANGGQVLEDAARRAAAEFPALEVDGLTSPEVLVRWVTLLAELYGAEPLALATAVLLERPARHALAARITGCPEVAYYPMQRVRVGKCVGSVAPSSPRVYLRLDGADATAGFHPAFVHAVDGEE